MAMILQRSRFLIFCINPVGNFLLCHGIKQSMIVFLGFYLSLCPLIFPAVFSGPLLFIMCLMNNDYLFNVDFSFLSTFDSIRLSHLNLLSTCCREYSCDLMCFTHHRFSSSHVVIHQTHLKLHDNRPG